MGQKTGRGGGWRREAWGPAVLLVVVLALFGDVLFVQRDAMLSAAGADAQTQFVPWREFAKREVLGHGNLPLWNPYVFCGTPFVGAMQVGAFYPPNWLGLAMPVGAAINWEVALHVWLAGVFTYGWGRFRGIGRLGATVAGCVYVLSSPYLLHLLPGHVPFLCVAAWSPLVMWCGDGMRRWAQCGRLRTPVVWGLVGAFAVAMQVLAGYPQPAYIAGLVGTVYLGVCLIRVPWRRAAAAIGTWFAMYAVAALLSAVQLGAAVAVNAESGRSGRVPWDFAVSYSVPARNFLEAVVPGIWGDVVHGRYHGEWLNWEVTPYFGVGALGLAVVSLACGRGRWRWVLFGMAAGCVVAAMGDGTPLYRVPYWVVPGVARFRVPGRFLYAAAMFIAMLAGMGVEAARQRPRRAMAVGVAMIALAVAVAGLGAVIRSTGAWAAVLAHVGRSATHLMQVRPETLRDDATFVGMATAAAARRCFWIAPVIAAFGAALVLAPRRRRGAACAAGAIAAAELFAHAWAGLAYCHPHAAYPPAWQAAAAAAAELRDRRVVCPIEAYANVGMAYGVENVLGYDPVVLRRYAQFLAWCDGERDMDAVVEARYLVRPPPRGAMAMTRVAAALVDPARVTPVDAGALGRVEVVGRGDVLVTREAALGRVCAADFDPRAEVVLESPPAVAPAGGKGAGRVVRETTDEIEIEATVDAPAVLLVTDAYSRGWTARAMPGSAQSQYAVVPADYVLRGVPVGAGHHHFVMTYRPTAWVVGGWVTAVSLPPYFVGCGMWIATRVRRPRA